MNEFTQLETKTIKALKNNADIITDSHETGAIISGYNADFKIGNTTFGSLLSKGIIYQTIKYPFYYLFNKNSELINNIES